MLIIFTILGAITKRFIVLQEVMMGFSETFLIGGGIIAALSFFLGMFGASCESYFNFKEAEQNFSTFLAFTLFLGIFLLCLGAILLGFAIRYGYFAFAN